MLVESSRKIFFAKIIGWAIVQEKYNERLLHSAHPICPDAYSDIGDDIDISTNGKIINILPATNDYKVFGEMPNEIWAEIGIHYGGNKTTNLNWDEKFDKALEEYHKKTKTGGK